MFADPIEILPQLDLRPGMQIADIGCGVGSYVLPLARMFAGTHTKIFAIDVQKSIIDRLKNEVDHQGLSGHIEFIWSDVEEPLGTRLRESSVDAVILANILFLTEQKETLMRECCRILKTGGMLVVIDWSDTHGGLGPRPDQIITESQAHTLCEKNGFTFHEKLNTGEHHYGFIMSKV